jgi:small subunit ribosomal protein S2
MRGLPSAMLIIDIKKEHIAVEEARKLGIPIFALVDTNVDPDLVDYPIPANDDALRSVQLFVHAFADAINNGRAAARARRTEESIPENRPELNLERRGRRVELEASDFMPVLQQKEQPQAAPQQPEPATAS